MRRLALFAVVLPAALLVSCADDEASDPPKSDQAADVAAASVNESAAPVRRGVIKVEEEGAVRWIIDEVSQTPVEVAGAGFDRMQGLAPGRGGFSFEVPGCPRLEFENPGTACYVLMDPPLLNDEHCPLHEIATISTGDCWQLEEN